MPKGTGITTALLAILAIALAGCGLQHQLAPGSDLGETLRYQRWLGTGAPGVGTADADLLAVVEGNGGGRDETPLKLNGKLTLHDAVQLAIAYNRDLRSVVEARAIASGVDLASWSGVLPRVTADAGYTHSGDRTRLTLAGQTLDLGALDTYGAGLRIQQPIFHGGAISAQQRIAQLELLIADRAVQDRLQDTALAVMDAYYQVQLCRALLSADHDATQSAKAFLDDVVKKRAQGVATEYDEVRAQVEWANLDATEREQANALALKNAALLSQIGAAFDSRIEPTDALEFHPYPVDFATAVKLAFARRPDLQAGQAQIAAQVARVDADHAGYYPQVDAFAQERWQRPQPSILTADGWGDRWEVGVQLSWNLFDGFAREGQIRQDQARLRQSQWRQQERERKLVLDIRQNVLELDSAAKLVAAQEINLQRAQLAMKLAEDGVRRGTQTALDLAESRSAMTKAQGFYQRALYRHLIAKARLQRAVGVLQ